MAAGGLGLLLRCPGWRGTYPGFEWYADFGHFLGVSQWRYPVCQGGSAVRRVRYWRKQT